MGNEAVVERDSEEIAAEAYAEQDNADKGIVTDPKEKLPTHKDDDESGQTDDKADDQAEGAEDGKGAEGDEGKADEEGAEGADDKGKEEDLDKKITEHAEKHRMTYAEAKEDIEKTEEIIKQYKNDPAEMARAMRNKDREYHKLRTEVEKAAKKSEPVFKRMSDDQFRDWAKNDPLKEGSENRQKMVDGYRSKFPARSEAMSDEAIIEEVVERELMIYKEKAGQKEQEIKTSASKRRDEFIASIPEADRRFIPEIKAVLLETPDDVIIRDGFDIKDAMYWAKGKAYDADIKAAEERALKRYRENPEIVGTKGGGSSKPQTSGKSSGLNDNQKNVARAMFGADYDDDKCFEMFQDTYKDELKKNPKFDPNKD